MKGDTLTPLLYKNIGVPRVSLSFTLIAMTCRAWCLHWDQWATFPSISVFSSFTILCRQMIQRELFFFFQKFNAISLGMLLIDIAENSYLTWWVWKLEWTIFSLKTYIDLNHFQNIFSPWQWQIREEENFVKRGPCRYYFCKGNIIRNLEYLKSTLENLR